MIPTAHASPLLTPAHLQSWGATGCPALVRRAEPRAALHSGVAGSPGPKNKRFRTSNDTRARGEHLRSSQRRRSPAGAGATAPRACAPRGRPEARAPCTPSARRRTGHSCRASQQSAHQTGSTLPQAGAVSSPTAATSKADHGAGLLVAECQAGGSACLARHLECILLASPPGLRAVSRADRPWRTRPPLIPAVRASVAPLQVIPIHDLTGLLCVVTPCDSAMPHPATSAPCEAAATGPTTPRPGPGPLNDTGTYQTSCPEGRAAEIPERRGPE